MPKHGLDRYTVSSHDLIYYVLNIFLIAKPKTFGDKII